MGSAGTLAAEFAAGELGLRVAAVERERIGGDCLWTGCVPSKTLIASARVAHTVAPGRAVRRGGRRVATSTSTPCGAGSARVQAEIAASDDSPERFEQMGVDVITGTATITGYTRGDRRHRRRARACSRPATCSCAPAAGRSPHRFPGSPSAAISRPTTCSDSIDRPQSLVVIGGGPIGVEIAQAMVRLGVPTTVLESRAPDRAARGARTRRSTGRHPASRGRRRPLRCHGRRASHATATRWWSASATTEIRAAGLAGRDRPRGQRRAPRPRPLRHPVRARTASRSTGAAARSCPPSTWSAMPPPDGRTSPTSRPTTPSPPCATCSSPGRGLPAALDPVVHVHRPRARQRRPHRRAGPRSARRPQRASAAARARAQRSGTCRRDDRWCSSPS